MFRLIALTKLSGGERWVVAMFRDASAGELSRGARRDFRLLREEAVAAGMSFPAATGPYLGRDEMRILALLTLFQRRRGEKEVRVCEPLRAPLVQCAYHLNHAGVHLDYRNIARDQWQTDVATGPARDVKDLGPRLQAVPLRGALQRHALRFIGERGRASTQELNAIGVSRQTISIMIKRGFLRRIRFGLYAIAPGPASLPDA
ncbi:hypothetical protein [Tardiphaga sp.]|uniref:hypothetical protein n=1 Tax=Tardiphaga sp. TaxID=1926292 RepID=UPI00352A637E